MKTPNTYISNAESIRRLAKEQRTRQHEESVRRAELDQQLVLSEAQSAVDEQLLCEIGAIIKKNAIEGADTASIELPVKIACRVPERLSWALMDTVSQKLAVVLSSLDYKVGISKPMRPDGIWRLYVSWGS